MANNKSTIQWNDAGFGAILQSPKLKEICLDAAAKISRRVIDEHGAYSSAEAWVSHGIGKVKYDRVAALVTVETGFGDDAATVARKAVAQCSIGTK